MLSYSATRRIRLVAALATVVAFCCLMPATRAMAYQCHVLQITVSGPFLVHGYCECHVLCANWPPEDYNNYESYVTFVCTSTTVSCQLPCTSFHAQNYKDVVCDLDKCGGYTCRILLGEPIECDICLGN